MASAIILLVLIICLFFNQKVLPKEICLEEVTYKKDGIATENCRASVKYITKGKKGKLIVSTPNEIVGSAVCSATFKLVAVDKRYIKSRDRKIRIIDISSPNNTVLVDKNKFFKLDNGKFVDQANKIAASRGEVVNIQFDTNITMVEIKSDISNLTCRLKTK